MSAPIADARIDRPGARLLDRARREGTPLVDRDRATFVWEGPRPPRLIGDFTHWEREPLALRRADDGIWSRSIEFYDDAYVEYAYLDGERRVNDPFNRRRIPNGVGAVNHSFYMPRGSPTPLARRRRGVPRGRLMRHVIVAKGLVARGRRTIQLYAPPARGPWPLLVVFDGADYVRRVRLPTIADNLIADGRTRPFAMALVDSDRDARIIEYAASEPTLTFVLDHVMPFAREQLDLSSTHSAHAVLGASMGGIMAMYAALQAPGTFGAVISQSGAFWLPGWRDNAVFYLARAVPRRVRRVWMDVGHLEYLVAGNRRLRRLLRSRGYDVTYREYHGGHNWTAWRDEVWRALEAVFGA